MLQLDTRKLILVKADISQYSGDSESDRCPTTTSIINRYFAGSELIFSDPDWTLGIYR